VTTSAGSITVAQTLELLDTEHATLAEGVAAGRYMFWLGSGISRDVVPGLDGVVRKVLEHLQSRMAPGVDGDRFRETLRVIVEQVAELSQDEKSRLNIDEPVDSWEDAATIIGRLVNKYSLMLDQGVEDEPPDYLLWEGVNPVATYGAPKEPDVEHLCLAILSLEGVIAVMASANWDGLIEAALRKVTTDPDQYLNVVVLQQDIRAGIVPTELLKFHGCAVLAGSGGPDYREALVGRQGQIDAWETLDHKAAVRAKMLSFALQKPTLMVGFSAQDGNIQRVFSAVKRAMPWPWPSEPPALAFAEDKLGLWQKQALKATYGDTVYTANLSEIVGASLVRAYGKPLLTALLLDVLARKAHALINSVDTLSTADTDALCSGVTAIRDGVASNAGTGTKVFLYAFLACMARLESLYHQGTEPASLEIYERLTMLPTCQLATGSSLKTDGAREMAISLALVGRGVASSGWMIDVEPTSTGTHGALRIIDPAGTERAVFFTATGHAAVELQRIGPLAAGGSDAIIIHCDDPADPLPRSPSKAPGRTGALTAAHVAIRELLRESADAAALHRGFCLRTSLPT
jgi:hypothetical protein